ncbi:hypothetical protein NDA13_002276 [Ustilago tritici]|nr:hypothetical protein NDA13_002276 [Ustilago tritici]
MSTKVSDNVLRWAHSHPIAAGILGLLLVATLYIGLKDATKGPSVWAHFPGPERTSYFLGYLRDSKKKFGVKNPNALDRKPIIGDAGTDITDDPGISNARLFEEHNTDHLVFPRPLGGELLVTRDAATMNHVLNDSYNYTRSSAGTKATKIIIGNGIVAVFGDGHKKQRRMLAPAFSVDSLKQLMPIFTHATNQNVGSIRKGYLAGEEMRSELIKTSQKIVEAKAKQIRKELEAGVDAKETFGGRKDILHLLMRANMSPDIREEDRLSDEVLAGQIITFIFAGHETTATTISWCTYFLTLNPEYQRTLRGKIQSALRALGKDGEAIGDLTYADLNSEEMRPLDQCIQETLRLRPPVVTTFRYSKKDDQLAVTRPFKTKDGRTLSTIPLHAKSKLPSPYGSFVFNGGPKVCIGSKFAMTEMKIIMIRMLAKYRMEPVEGLKYKSVEAVVQRPAVIGFEKEGSQLPLRFISDPL